MSALIAATHAAVPLEPGQGGNAAALRDGIRVPWTSWWESTFVFFLPHLLTKMTVGVFLPHLLTKMKVGVFWAHPLTRMMRWVLAGVFAPGCAEGATENAEATRLSNALSLALP